MGAGDRLIAHMDDLPRSAPVPQQILQVQRVGGCVSVDNVLFTPTVSYFNESFRDNEIYLLSDFTSELCNSHCVVKRGWDGTFGGVMTLSSLRYYLNNAISDEYLPEAFRKGG